jgi:hypothetical protein
MSKVLCGILNWDRSDSIIKKLVNKIPQQYKIVIVTNNDKLSIKNADILTAVESIAESKNMILQYAKDNNFDYCFIIEDDVKILYTSVFSEYINMLNQYEQPIVFYGFHNRNRVFRRPNPAMVVGLRGTNILYLNRFPCGAFVLFKVSDDMQMYDTRLKWLENDYILADIAKHNDKLVLGFYYDIVNSHQYISRLDIPTARKNNSHFIQHDLDIRKERITLVNTADSVLSYIKERNR